MCPIQNITIEYYQNLTYIGWWETHFLVMRWQYLGAQHLSAAEVAKGLQSSFTFRQGAGKYIKLDEHYGKRYSTFCKITLSFNKTQKTFRGIPLVLTNYTFLTLTNKSLKVRHIPWIQRNVCLKYNWN